MCCMLGCSRRKQFEEEFTTLLLLLNQDINFEDPEDQFRFKQLCLTGMISLLVLSCYRCSLSDDLNKYFLHSARFESFDSKHVGLQKLKINQILTNCQRNSAFNELNLEKIKFGSKNSSVFTESFGRNQFSLDFVWQQNEENPSASRSSLLKEDMTFLLGRTGIDLESFLHLIYDVFTEQMKSEPILLFSPLILLSEVCNNTAIFKTIYEAMLELIEETPMEEFVTHHYIFSLISKSASSIVPTFNDLNELQIYIYRYITSNHILLDISILRGFLGLLECFLKTSTCMGKLSDEIQLLKTIIFDYGITQTRLRTK